MRLITVNICLLIFSLQTQAQTAIGGKIGVSIANVATNVSDPNAKSKIGVNGGFVFAYGIGNGKISFVGELLFTQKGGNNIVSGDVNRFYIEIPAMLRYGFSIVESFPLRIFINAGPYLGLGFGQRSGGDAYYNKDAGSTNVMEMGVAAGGGFMYPAGPGNIFVEGRYSYALTNLVNKTLERNEYTAISAGYLYTLKGKSQEEKDKTIAPGFE
ncbi:MAG: porin family protein [Bacteroidota bacterium]|nr:porin family protein [Bacteroidota bacterium]